MWAGTDDGLIWTTEDAGAHWTNVTPPALKPFWKVFNMDAGHFDAQTAYAAVNTMRLDDMRPHLFRTHDGGKTWTEIDNGIPDGAATSAIREDPKRKGLLYAGSETQVYVSFDDGDHWQSLRLNMPASSVRDLEVKDDDLIAATHGRGYLILDDVTPLRQIAVETAEDAHLYAPQTAMRIRNDMNPPTPWPADFPTTSNPPNGAVIDYYLGRKRVRRSVAGDCGRQGADDCALQQQRSGAGRRTRVIPTRRFGRGRRECCRPRRGIIGSCGTCSIRRCRGCRRVRMTSWQHRTTRRRFLPRRGFCRVSTRRS